MLVENRCKNLYSQRYHKADVVKGNIRGIDISCFAIRAVNFSFDDTITGKLCDTTSEAYYIYN